MGKSTLLSLSAALVLAAASYFFTQKMQSKPAKTLSEAGMAFQYWGMARTFPDGKFYTEKYSQAMAQMRLSAQLRDERSPTWESLGPDNIGGRTLCMAINPLDTNIIWLGSASGGIWKSTTAGNGAQAWQRVETGFPVLGVSALALAPDNPNVLYAGTGEVYNVENSSPNVAIRVTRGTYGIGILKSTDGGATWSKSLDWSYGQLRGIQDIKINPLRSATVLAATTEGLLRSWDAGATWHTIHNKRMAVDIEIDPVDTNRIYVTHGSLDDQDVSGIYRSSNGGSSFTKAVSPNFPSTFSGKALLTLCPTQPEVLYASIGNAFAQNGLYKSTNRGNSWFKVNDEDVCKYQGWYSHDVAVHPMQPDTFIWVGIDTWKSTNSGNSVTKKTSWNNWFFGTVPAGSAEGPSDYVHADIHRVYYAPNDPNKVYSVTDGGLFVSYDGGETWQGRNGGYQTQQFYANLGNSTTNPQRAVGGMQDNSTAVYQGNPSWRRVLGGDGQCAGIDPSNDAIMYGSSQYLNLFKSINGGQNWFSIGDEITGNSAFNGPFEIAPSNPNILYAGAQGLWYSDNSGLGWSDATGTLSNGSVVLTIAVDPTNPYRVFCSTVSTSLLQAQLYKVNVQNAAVEELAGLPNRICMDIGIHPNLSSTIIAVFGGFNTQHVWRSTDGGIHWEAIDNGLPDVPTNSVLIDPATGHYYVANDLGVWHSADEGATWAVYSAEAPQAMLAMHLSIAPGQKLRVATYGLGVWQTDLAKASKTAVPSPTFQIRNLRPNPASERAWVDFELQKTGKASLKVLDTQGKTIWQNTPETLSTGSYSRSIPLANWPEGAYVVQLECGSLRLSRVLMVR